MSKLENWLEREYLNSVGMSKEALSLAPAKQAIQRGVQKVRSVIPGLKKAPTPAAAAAPIHGKHVDLSTQAMGDLSEQQLQQMGSPWRLGVGKQVRQAIRNPDVKKGHGFVSRAKARMASVDPIGARRDMRRMVASELGRRKQLARFGGKLEGMKPGWRQRRLQKQVDRLQKGTAQLPH